MVTCATTCRGTHAYYVPISMEVHGIYGYYVSHALKQLGRHRVQNLGVEGYVAYVGSGGLPNFTASPAAFSATLPMTVSLAPGATYQVVIRKRNSYKLESQNQRSTEITVDGGGVGSLPPVPEPSSVKALVLVGGFIRILANYPNLDTDRYPATQWYIWIESILTPPEFQQDVNDAPGLFWTSADPYIAGTYNVRVALRRVDDDAISDIVSFELEIPGSPSSVTPVASGFAI